MSEVWADLGIITKEELRLYVHNISPKTKLDEIINSIILAYIERTHGNYSKAAKILGISRQTIYNRLHGELS